MLQRRAVPSDKAVETHAGAGLLASDEGSSGDGSRAEEGASKQVAVYGTIRCDVAGLRFVSGGAKIGERIFLLREPRHPHCSTAIRVSNAQGEQVGYIDGNVGRVLSPVWDREPIRLEALAEGVGGGPFLLCSITVSGPDDPARKAAVAEGLRTIVYVEEAEHEAKRTIGYGTLWCDVVGLRFVTGGARIGDPLFLQREPQNLESSTAIRASNALGEQVGYISGNVSRFLSPIWDSEPIRLKTRIEGVVIDPPLSSYLRCAITLSGPDDPARKAAVLDTLHAAVARLCPPPPPPVPPRDEPESKDEGHSERTSLFSWFTRRRQPRGISEARMA